MTTMPARRWAEDLSEPNASAGANALQAGLSPLVSVVILNFNYAHYLRQCIDSVLAQDYAHIETIVVDDGSTDESREVIASYAGRVRAAFKLNGGMVSSMNHGFALSRGSVVVFLDADDYLFSGAVACHVRALNDPTVVRSQIRLVAFNGTVATGRVVPAAVAGVGDLRALVLKRGPGAYVSSPNSGNAWARRCLDHLLPLPIGPRRLGAETYLMDAAPLFGRVVMAEGEPLGVYRTHDTSMSSTLTSMTADGMRQMLDQYDARMRQLARVLSGTADRRDAATWMPRNWRLLTLSFLLHRSSDRPERPALLTHLRAALGVDGGVTKRTVLAAAILFIRYAPTRLSLHLAGRLIDLRYM
jgi:hypothetical protein